MGKVYQHAMDEHVRILQNKMPDSHFDQATIAKRKKEDE